MKKYLVFLAAILIGICLFNSPNKASAVTISDDGKYSLILNVTVENGSIEGKRRNYS